MSNAVCCAYFMYYRLEQCEILMTLDSGQFYGVRYLPEKSSILLDIFFKEVQPCSTENRSAVIEFMQSNIDGVCKVFMPVCTPPIAYVCCQICSIPCIKLEDLRKKVIVPCKDSCTCNGIDEEHYHDLLEHYHDLLFDGGIVCANTISPCALSFPYIRYQ